MYFLLLLIMNITQIIVAAEAPGNNLPAFFISPVTSILISRFLLNLREVAQRSETDDSKSAIISTQFPSIVIPASLLGNIGEPLYSGIEDEQTVDGAGEEDKLSCLNQAASEQLSRDAEISRADDVQVYVV
ncbi:hypothetical protein C8Q79DRAFT_648256 [Trametes meyenii]|nr:hypothetical protein C8Q79DRAFT_648256 [Trametes meyenii]